MNSNWTGCFWVLFDEFLGIIDHVNFVVFKFQKFRELAQLIDNGLLVLSFTSKKVIKFWKLRRDSWLKLKANIPEKGWFFVKSSNYGWFSPKFILLSKTLQWPFISILFTSPFLNPQFCVTVQIKSLVIFRLNRYCIDFYVFS